MDERRQLGKKMARSIRFERLAVHWPKGAWARIQSLVLHAAVLSNKRSFIPEQALKAAHRPAPDTSSGQF